MPRRSRPKCRAKSPGPARWNRRCGRACARGTSATSRCSATAKDRQLLEIVRGARAVVVPSEWYEPFSLVILEAMAAARPVIASRIAGPAEIISHGADGLLVPPGSAEEFAAAFRALWRDPARAIEMGRRGLEKTRTLYAPDAHYRRLMRHFEEVLQ